MPVDASNKSIIWSTSNSSVARVNDEGQITGVAAGEAAITATSEDGSKTDTCYVSVSNFVIDVTSVTLDKTELKLNEGDKATLTKSILPTDATNQNVTWTSSNFRMGPIKF